jgi:hypothetical protein
LARGDGAANWVDKIKSSHLAAASTERALTASTISGLSHPKDRSGDRLLYSHPHHRSGGILAMRLNPKPGFHVFFERQFA